MPSGRVTVLVPTYNHAQYIAQAIKSITEQSIFDECCIIISDDCSTDDTFDIARSACNHYPNVAVRRNAHNLGIMRHYQCLAEFVETPFVAVLEGDDIWTDPSKLNGQRAMLSANSGASFCFSGYVVNYVEEQRAVPQPVWNVGRNRILGPMDLIYENPIASFSNCFYPAPLFKDLMRSPVVLDGYDWLFNFLMSQSGPICFWARTATSYNVHPHGAWSRMSRHAQRKLIRRNLQNFRNEKSLSYEAYIIDALEMA